MMTTKTDLIEKMRTARERTGMRLSRTIEGAWRVRQERNALWAAMPEPARPAFRRLEHELAARYTAEIVRRGGETEIEESSGSAELEVHDRDIATRLCLLRCEGWRQYSKGFGARPASLAYLCGSDDNGAWAVRVPGTAGSVVEALEYVEPPQVHRAREAGRRVLRQGDVYAVEGRTDAPTSPSDSHEWHHRARLLLHTDPERPHAPLHVPYRCRLYRQRALGMGRGAGRGAYAD